MNICCRARTHERHIRARACTRVRASVRVRVRVYATHARRVRVRACASHRAMYARMSIPYARTCVCVSRHAHAIPYDVSDMRRNRRISPATYVRHHVYAACVHTRHVRIRTSEKTHKKGAPPGTPNLCSYVCRLLLDDPSRALHLHDVRRQHYAVTSATTSTSATFVVIASSVTASSSVSGATT